MAKSPLISGAWKSLKSVGNQVDFEISYTISASVGPLIWRTKYCTRVERTRAIQAKIRQQIERIVRARVHLQRLYSTLRISFSCTRRHSLDQSVKRVDSCSDARVCSQV